MENIIISTFINNSKNTITILSKLKDNNVHVYSIKLKLKYDIVTSILTELDAYKQLHE